MLVLQVSNLQLNKNTTYRHALLHCQPNRSQCAPSPTRRITATALLQVVW